MFTLKLRSRMDFVRCTVVPIQSSILAIAFEAQENSVSPVIAGTVLSSSQLVCGHTSHGSTSGCLEKHDHASASTLCTQRDRAAPDTCAPVLISAAFLSRLGLSSATSPASTGQRGEQPSFLTAIHESTSEW